MVDNQADDRSEIVEVLNPDGEGVALILCEHASNFIPEKYDALGLSDADRLSHIAWDPGARELAIRISRALNSPMVASCVSRLVYDCNRPPEARTAMPEKSEVIDVPGNRGLSNADRVAREEEVYAPFCAAVQKIIQSRRRLGKPTVLVTVHSFTPTYFGKPRTVEIGILHDHDQRVADAMLEKRHLMPHRQIKRNTPYGPSDGVTHSLIKHGIQNGLPNVMLEIRNDLLRGSEDQDQIAQEILTLLIPAFEVANQCIGGSARA